MVAPQPFYQDRGTPIALLHVLTELSRRGVSVDLVTFPIGRSVERDGLRIFRSANPLGLSSVPIGLSWRKLVLDAFLIPAFFFRLRARRYSFIHAVEEAAFPAVVIGRMRGVPVVYDMQSSLPEQLKRSLPFRCPPVPALLSWLERWLLENADRVACSAGLEATVRRIAPCSRVIEWRFPASSPRVSAAEVSRIRRSLELAGDAEIVLYSGNFAPYQDLGLLFEAMPRVIAQRPRSVLVLVGGDEESVARFLPPGGALLGDSRVRIVARQPRHEIDGYLAAADVLVSPRSGGGNVPLKMFDYLATDRPIVAIDVPMNHRVVGPGRAHLVAARPDSLAEGIIEALRSRRESVATISQPNTFAARSGDAFRACVDRLYEGLLTDSPKDAKARTRQE